MMTPSALKGGKGPYADQDTYNGPNKNILIEDCFFDHTTGSCMTLWQRVPSMSIMY